VPVDVTARSSVAALAARAAQLGPVTAVVHTAGVSPEQADIDTILAVDLLGVALVLDEFGQAIAPGGAGVVIASMAGHLHPALDPAVAQQLETTPADQLLALDACASDHIANSQQAYMFAKRANHHRVAASAAAWGRRGGRINSVSPGIVATEMGRRELSGTTGQLIAAMSAGCGVRRLGTPDDIAAAIHFLLSADANLITAGSTSSSRTAHRTE
jgi:NAD(P)-dependent dehydrogenase (short-subunit alcohol dehydrogenase family)